MPFVCVYTVFFALALSLSLSQGDDNDEDEGTQEKAGEQKPQKEVSAETGTGH